MNGKQMLERAAVLLNYTDGEGHPADDAMRRRAIGVINQIAADLWYAGTGAGEWQPLTRLEDSILLDERTVRDVMPYGVAMLMAQSEGDADNQALFAAIYNRKRAAAGGIARRQDILP